MECSFKKVFVVICVLKWIVVLLFFYGFSSKEKRVTIVQEDPSELKLEPRPGITGLPSTCKLPNINPWNKEIMQYVDLDYYLDPLPKNFIETNLQNGTIFLTYPWFGCAKCFGRCLSRKTQKTTLYGRWKNINGTTFDCDVVQVTCKFYLLCIFPYNYNSVHSQIVPVPRKTQAPQEKKHSIYAIVVDSTGHTQSNRNLPKTLHFMKERFEATSFPYLNKAAPNSRPNGYALLLGKSVVATGNTPPDLDELKVCEEPLDSYWTIFDDMRESGYRTMYSEDWPTTYYLFPDCKGFERELLDHSVRPLLQEISFNNPLLQMKYQIYDLQRNPKPSRTIQLLDYFGNFIDSYKNESKFGWIWTMDVSHDNEDSSIALDTMLYKLFVKHQDELDNSYVFIMGDHGLRHGKVLQTEAAKLDLSNPMLAFSIPKELRNPKVKEITENNAKHLVTHYDTRATWLDIAKFQNGEIDSAYMKIPGEKGESFLRKQTEDRTCQSLPIPSVYCICDYEKETISTNSSEALIMGKRVIVEVNNYLVSYERRIHLCGKWVFSEVVSLQGITPVDETGMYYITVRTSEPYDRALFSTIISVKPTGELEVGPLDRKDRYENRGDCSSVPLFCHCV